MDGRLLWNAKSHEQQQQQTENYEWRPLFFRPLEQTTRAISRNTTDSGEVAPEEWGPFVPSGWKFPLQRKWKKGKGLGI